MAREILIRHVRPQDVRLWPIHPRGEIPAVLHQGGPLPLPSLASSSPYKAASTSSPKFCPTVRTVFSQDNPFLHHLWRDGLSITQRGNHPVADHVWVSLMFSKKSASFCRPHRTHRPAHAPPFPTS